MSNDKMVVGNRSLVQKLNQSLRVGSLTDLIRVRQNENVLLLLDCSGSMDSRIANGQTRSAALGDTVRGIQSEKELKMAQFGSGHEPSFVTMNAIPPPCGGTPLHLAIDFGKSNGHARLIVISDGCPDSEHAALEAANRFGGRIDVVFIGNKGERGEAFLLSLARTTGGESFTGDLTNPKQLAGKIVGLLSDGKDDDEDDDDA